MILHIYSSYSLLVRRAHTNCNVRVTTTRVGGAWRRRNGEQAFQGNEGDLPSFLRTISTSTRWKRKVSVFLGFRLKMKFSCMMDLEKYPLDLQICTMEVASCKLGVPFGVVAWQHHFFRMHYYYLVHYQFPRRPENSSWSGARIRRTPST